MARNDPQVNFRIPADLKARLEAEALANNRTLTAELVARLQTPPLAEALTERMERSAFELNYSLARFGAKMLKYAAETVLKDAPVDFQNSSAYRLLRAASEVARMPPDLPACLSLPKETQSFVDVERALDELRLAVEASSVEATTK